MELSKMKNGLAMVSLVLLLAQQVQANFHVVNTRQDEHFNLNVLPSNNYVCGGIEQPLLFNENYPPCGRGDINIPNGQCGWQGARIRPNCQGNYFGQVIGASGEDQGYCYWNDAGESVGFRCGNMRVYDRLVCITAMCG